MGQEWKGEGGRSGGRGWLKSRNGRGKESEGGRGW